MEATDSCFTRWCCYRPSFCSASVSHSCWTDSVQWLDTLVRLHALAIMLLLTTGSTAIRQQVFQPQARQGSNECLFQLRRKRLGVYQTRLRRRRVRRQRPLQGLQLRPHTISVQSVWPRRAGEGLAAASGGQQSLATATTRLPVAIRGRCNRFVAVCTADRSHALPWGCQRYHSLSTRKRAIGPQPRATTARRWRLRNSLAHPAVLPAPS